MPIFKDPDVAYEQALIDFADGFFYLQNEFDLPKVSENQEDWEG